MVALAQRDARTAASPTGTTDRSSFEWLKGVVSPTLSFLKSLNSHKNPLTRDRSQNLRPLAPLADKGLQVSQAMVSHSHLVSGVQPSAQTLARPQPPTLYTDRIEEERYQRNLSAFIARTRRNLSYVCRYGQGQWRISASRS